MDLILAIAALCQIYSGQTSENFIAKKQLECQQYYAKCVNPSNPVINLLACIKEKK